MPKRITGGCLCGAIRYTSESSPILTAICSCKKCQRQTGSSFSILVALAEGTLVFEKGVLAAYLDTGSSGLPVSRQFCSDCGSPIVSTVAATPGLSWLKAGSLDDPSWLQPSVSIWCESAQPWLALDDSITQYARGIPS